MKESIKNKFNPSDIEKRLLSASIWNLLGNGFARLIMLVASIFLARILGAEDFGKWGVIRSAISMFVLFLSFSLSVTAIRYIAKYRTDNKEKAGRILTLSFLMAFVVGTLVTVLIFIFSDTIASRLLNDTTITKPLSIASFFVLLMSLNSVLVGALSGLENFKFIAISNFIAGILAAPIIIILTQYYTLDGITFGYIIYYLILFITLFYFLHKELKVHRIKFITSKLKNELSIFHKFSLPALVSGSIGGPTVFAVFAYVANLSGGFIIIGLFSAAKIFQGAIVELGSQLQDPLISLLSNTKDSKEVFALNFTVPLIYVTIFILPIIFIPELVTWVFNKGDYDTNDFTLVVSLTLFTAAIMIFKQGINRMIITNELLWWGVYENIFWGSILLLLSWFLIPQFGAVGMALSFSLAYLIDLLAIMPFYYFKGLIPKSIFFSLEIIIFLSLFILGTLCIYWDITIYLRLLLLFISLLTMYFIVLRLNKNLTTKSNI